MFVNIGKLTSLLTTDASNISEVQYRLSSLSYSLCRPLVGLLAFYALKLIACLTDSGPSHLIFFGSDTCNSSMTFLNLAFQRKDSARSLKLVLWEYSMSLRKRNLVISDEGLIYAGVK